jgi:hypothetical protein
MLSGGKLADLFGGRLIFTVRQVRRTDPVRTPAGSGVGT